MKAKKQEAEFKQNDVDDFLIINQLQDDITNALSNIQEEVSEAEKKRCSQAEESSLICVINYDWLLQTEDLTTASLSKTMSLDRGCRCDYRGFMETRFTNYYCIIIFY